jgi:ABC-type sugar transport system ATPase subunit
MSPASWKAPPATGADRVGTRVVGLVRKGAGYGVDPGRVRAVAVRSVGEAVRYGIAYATEDRKRYGLNLIEDIKRNVSAAGLTKLAKRGLPSTRASRFAVAPR